MISRAVAGELGLIGSDKHWASIGQPAGGASCLVPIRPPESAGFPLAERLDIKFIGVVLI